MKKKLIRVVSLGCSKNLIDSEHLMKMLSDVGYDTDHVAYDELNPEYVAEKADVVVLNTCGFIGDAKEQSIEAILNAINGKQNGDIGQVCVMGCLSERHLQELKAELPEVDRWYGKFNWEKMTVDLARKTPATAPYERILTTGPHHAYIKIAEGCNRFCSFCAIPLITGRFKSRPIDEIIDEVTNLVAKGVHEFNIIAQDLSSYGLDLPGNKHRLAELIDRIADVEGVEWIRLHYAYPADFPYDILPAMARRSNVCKYLDIALQHISDPVLANMRRHITGKETIDLIKRIRAEVPGIHLRTTLMVGFPGEGEKEFEELLDFTRQMKFERMGAFAYCEEEDTFGARNFKDEIPQEVKEARLDKLMELQETISMDIQSQKIGKKFRVIIDTEDNDYYIGRTQWDSPEVDPQVLITKDTKLKRGEFYEVEITEATPFELYGKVV